MALCRSRYELSWRQKKTTQLNQLCQEGRVDVATYALIQIWLFMLWCSIAVCQAFSKGVGMIQSCITKVGCLFGHRAKLTPPKSQNLLNIWRQPKRECTINPINQSRCCKRIPCDLRCQKDWRQKVKTSQNDPSKLY